jgi:(p)ppGpp synthase/HD superfamily hydrolase
MTHSFYLQDTNIERQTRLDGRIKPDPAAFALWNRAVEMVSGPEDKALLLKAFSFARDIRYGHEGLTSDIYFAHPVRVAALSMLSQDNGDVTIGIIGLLHNVFELSDTPASLIADNFGIAVAEQITTLTVNRELQWEEAYKKSYYAKINASPLSCRVVKVFDKLDNMFLLGINPDEAIKEKYLLEIEGYILPMMERDIPDILPYMLQLIKDYHRIGFMG